MKNSVIGWMSKPSMIVFLTVLTSVVMLGGIISPLSADAAPVRVQSTTGGSPATATTTFNMTALPTAPVTGNTLVAVIATRGSAAGIVTSITQTGATWSRVAQSVGTGTTTEIWYAPNVQSAGTAITVNHASTIQTAAVVAEYSGILIAGAVDKTATATGAVAAAVTGTTTTTAKASELWIGAIGQVSSGYTIGTLLNSFSNPLNAASNNVTATNNARISLLERIVTATGAANSGATISAASQWSAAIATFQAPVSTCTTCHGGITDFHDGTNITTRSIPAGLFYGSHSSHVRGGGLACTVCHTSVGLVDYSHSNGNINMAATISGGVYTKAGFPTWAVTNSPTYTATCTNTYCHGTNSPAWGGTLGGTGCGACHSPVTDTASFRITAGTTNTINSTIHVAHLNTTHNISTNLITCADCHTVPLTSAENGHIDTALPAEVPMAGTLAAKNTARLFTPGTKACTNVYCHGTQPTTWNWTATKLASTIADCTLCHLLPPVGHAGGQITTIAGLSACSSLGASGGCHPDIAAAPSTYANIFADASLHINGNIEGGDCISCHNTATPTASPKRIAASSQFNAQSHHIQGRPVTKADCYYCHDEANSDGSINLTYHTKAASQPINLPSWATGSRVANSIQYTANGTRIEINKLTTFCTGCHNDTNKNLAPFTGDTRTTTAYAPEASNKSSVGARYGDTGTTPWGKYNSTTYAQANNKDGMIKAYSPHGNAANNAQGWSTAVGVDGYAPLAVSGAHSGTRTAIPNTTGTVQVGCYDCHNSHGSVASGITSSYSSSTGKYKGGLVKTTTNGLGGYVATYTPTQGGTALTRAGTLYNPGAALCFDCHINRTSNSTKPWGYNDTYAASQPILGYWDTRYFGNYTTFPSTKTGRYPYKGTASAGTRGTRDMSQHIGGHFGKYSTMLTTPKTAVNNICTPCHDPHGVSPNLSGNKQFAVPALKGTWVTSPYIEDAAPASKTETRGGGDSKGAGPALASTPGYNIDQNTLQADVARTARTAPFGAFATNANTLQNAATAALATYSSAKFAGLCYNCHSKATIAPNAGGAAPTWKSMARVHNTVKGFGSTGTPNAASAVHSYTCSKCHAPHNSRLPRLLVTNCLDDKHRARVNTGGAVGATATLTTSGNVVQSTIGAASGRGAGRFPSGGGRYTGTGGRASNPGPWFFGRTGQGTATTPAVATYGSACHESSTAGGTTGYPNNQKWTDKAIW